MPTVEKQPWVTISFYNDGSCQVKSGPGTFPATPEDIIKSAGAVLLILWQVGYQSYQGMLQNQETLAEAYKTLQTILKGADESKLQ